ncbi:HAMP domain-containing sensor histidine kinase [Brevundimonas sp.]|uniref:sensor histidine kinase n=1 Tax=Brevundimonas sp. TaxID=1871086 RepID=UPI0025F138A0|nr:HAMP domain-containing sensor histidine kinase [Brevundimonas sp.]
MKLPGLSGAWLAAFLTVLAAGALSASLALTHQAVRSEQRQRAALAALRDYGALLSKMDIMASAAPTDADYVASWLTVFQTRPGVTTSIDDACAGRQPNLGLRWVAGPDGSTAGTEALSGAEGELLEELGPNVYLLRLPRGAVCPDRAVELVAVRDFAGPMEVIVARMVERTGRAWGAAAVAVTAMAIVLLGIGLASAAWARTRMLSGVRRLNASLEQAGRGDFGEAIPVEEMTGDLRRLTQQVNVTLGRLKELLVWLRDSSDQLAHDFRTPLARARARLDQFASEGDPELIAQARADLRYLTQAMNESLSLRDGEAWAFEEVRLDLICASAAELYEPVAEAREIRIETELAPAPVLGVASLLQRAVANLVDNAVKYSPDGALVRIRAAPDGEGGSVSVTDQGPGMEATAARDASERPDSHRMGLGFVRAIARRHGGEIEIQSGPEGSTVTIRV